MRENMPAYLQDQLRAKIVRRQLPPGSRINEVHVAHELAVSRTPLREALTRLTGEALVEARPKLGFFVTPLVADELVQLYAIRAQLDPWALELAGIPEPSVLAALAKRNAMLGRATTADQAIELDNAWHLQLLAGCPNRVLVELVRQMMVRTQRYEHIYFSDRANRARAVVEHARLLAKLRRRDLSGACRCLAVNMSTSLPVIAARVAP